MYRYNDTAGNLQLLFNGQRGVIIALDIDYSDPWHLGFAVNRSFTGANSALSQLSSISLRALTSLQTDESGRMIVVALGGSDGCSLFVIVMWASNGSAIVGNRPIATSALCSGTFSYAAIEFDGSRWFLPSTDSRVVILQGFYVGANVIGDPLFSGLRGQRFQVHGVDGGVYNLISDSLMQLNTRFTILEGPRSCPTMPSTGLEAVGCWSHPGTYLNNLALQSIGCSKLLIIAGPAASGFALVSLDGLALQPNATAVLDFGETGLVGAVHLLNLHQLTIRAGHFDLSVENIDGFINLRSLTVLHSSWTKLASHGLLGQTWRNKRYDGLIEEIEGDVGSTDIPT